MHSELRFAVSRHDVAGGFERPGAAGSPENHLDWFFETDFAGPSRLLTFSTSLAIWGAGVFKSAVKLADHRAVYLHYEGEISNDRGQLRRLIWGRHRILSLTPERFVTTVISFETGDPGAKTMQSEYSTNCPMETSRFAGIILV